MKQVIIHKGIAIIHDVPAPSAAPGMIVIRNRYSVISTGTEAGTVAFSKKSLLEKIITERAKVEKGLKMIREKGFARTYQFVKGLLDFGSEAGYSSCGIVVAVGENVHGFAVGDLVSAAGAEYAHHAEIIAVPNNLCAKVPLGVDPTEAASATIGAIALQGVRQADVRLGESVLVCGLGLLGQLTVQMLVASGVRVFGIDLDDARIKLAESFCMEKGFRSDDSDLAQKIRMATGGHGVDATIITAATPSSAPTNAAFEYTRKRGRVVIVGNVGLSLNRSPWYEKEIEVRIATSYGPGRYDAHYERDGADYPYAYVRWTEQRNMEAYLLLLSEKKVRFAPLIAREFAVEDAKAAYEALAQKPLALILSYPFENQAALRQSITTSTVQKKEGIISLGVIGGGAFCQTVHLPNLFALKGRFSIAAIATNKGAEAKRLADMYGAPIASTSADAVIANSSIDAVLITTRHDTHAYLATAALNAGKHVFLEKPLAQNEQELSDVISAARTSGRVLMVGYNRRTSPALLALKKAVANRTHPLMVLYRVNAGYLPPEHWTQSLISGGRIIGEACHMLDVFSFLIGKRPSRSSASFLKSKNFYRADDNISATIEYEDGSLATLVYTAVGHKGLPKESIEVHCDGVSYVVDDFKELRSFGSAVHWRGVQDKGHKAELEIFSDSIKNGLLPIPLEELEDTSGLSFAIAQSVKGTEQ